MTVVIAETRASNLKTALLKFGPMKIMAILCGLVFFKLSNEIYTKEQFGEISLVNNTFSLITSLLFGWVGYVIIRFYPEYEKKGELQNFIKTIYTVQLFLVALVIVCCILFAILVRKDTNWILEIQIFGYPLSIASLNLANLYQMGNEGRKYNGIQIVGIIVTYGLSFVFLLFTDFVMEATFIGLAISNMIYAFMLGKYFKQNKIGQSVFDKTIIHKVVRYGVAQSLVSIGASILAVGDRAIINHYLGFESGGVYSTMYRFGEMSILLLLSVFGGVFGPYVFNTLATSGKEKAYYIIGEAKIIYLIAITPVVLYLCYVPELSTIVVDDKYGNDLYILPWIVVGVVLYGYAQITGLYFQIMLKSKYLVYSVFLAAGFNVMCNFLLIPRLGLLGAGIANFLSYLFYVVLIYYFCRREELIQLFAVNIVKIILAVIIAFTATHFATIIAGGSSVENFTICSIAIILFYVLLFLFGETNSVKLLRILTKKI
jgi:O-antigen/teichoic acid export membrane protein